MTITKKQIIIASILMMITLSVIIILSRFPKPMLHVDYPYYPDVESITDSADVIIVGEVIKAKEVQYLMVHQTSTETTPYTIATVKITAVLKGPVNIGDSITIKQLGHYKSKPEATLYEMDGYLSENTTHLMFLTAYPDSPYSPVNPAQGIVEVKEGNILYSNSKYSLFGYHADSENTTDTLDSAVISIQTCIDK